MYTTNRSNFWALSGMRGMLPKISRILFGGIRRRYSNCKVFANLKKCSRACSPVCMATRTYHPHFSQTVTTKGYQNSSRSVCQSDLLPLHACTDSYATLLYRHLAKSKGYQNSSSLALASLRSYNNYYRNQNIRISRFLQCPHT